jgi:hypothetical protein
LQGNLVDALTSYRAGLVIAERLAASDAGNADWQWDLSVSYDRVGEVLVKQDNLSDALTSYRAGLGIRERLVATDARQRGVAARSRGGLFKACGRAPSIRAPGKGARLFAARP